MGVILATVKKELISYLFSPVAYIIAVLLYLSRGTEVYRLVGRAADSHYDIGTFASYYVIYGPSTYFFFVLVPPILTMRCLAEERRTGSLEVLMTAPVRDFEIVIGKWFAALVFFGLLWLPTLPLLGLLAGDAFLGTSLSYGPVLSTYVGLFLLGAMLLAIGIFASSLTDNVLLASIVGMILNLGLIQAPSVLHPYLQQWFGNSYYINVFNEQSNVFDHLANWFGKGQIDSSKIFFYIGGTVFFLFLTIRCLESRKWR